jgi:two-component system LytT family sensor kinase
VTEKRIDIGAFLVGVVLLFTLKTSIEIFFPYNIPYVNFTQQIIFNLFFSLFVNLVVAVGTRRINTWLDKRLSWYETTVKRLILQAFATGVFAMIVVSAFAYVMIVFLLSFPDVNEAFVRTLFVGTIVVVILSALYTGVYFFEQWGNSRLEAERLKRENLHSQFSVLRDQLSPHFLFNSLSTLSSLIAENQNHAVEFVHNLASVYRYVLQSMERETVELETELAAARAFMFLHQTRFNGCVRLNIEVSEEHKHLFVAPLTLQILLENAIKHNIISKEKPLAVTISVEEGPLLVVKNNIQRKSSYESGTHIGLKNIINRYRLLRKKDVDIRETDSEFIVSVPLLKDSY